jgi:hypothetical protein
MDASTNNGGAVGADAVDTVLSDPEDDALLFSLLGPFLSSSPGHVLLAGPGAHDFLPRVVLSPVGLSSSSDDGAQQANDALSGTGSPVGAPGDAIAGDLAGPTNLTFEPASPSAPSPGLAPTGFGNEELPSLVAYGTSCIECVGGGQAGPPAPLPEPASWTMMFLGLSSIGLVLRRHRWRARHTGPADQSPGLIENH